MFGFRKKKAKKKDSVYLTFSEFKRLAKERKINKSDQFFFNYYSQLSNKKGLNEKDISHALNCLVINDANTHSKNSGHRIIDMTKTKTLHRFIEYIHSNRNQIKFIFLRLLPNSSSDKHLDLRSIDSFLYELIIDFLKTKCLCKAPQIPSFDKLSPFIKRICSQLSYFNDNRNIFSLSFLSQYLPICISKFNANKDETQWQMNELMEAMNALSATINDYSNDFGDIILNLQMRTNKLKSNTYPERIDELNNILNDLRKQMEVLADELTKVENEQLTAERSAENLRNRTLRKLNLSQTDSDNAFGILEDALNENGQNTDDGRRGSYSKSESKSQSVSQSLSMSQSHTIDSQIAATSIRKPFFLRPLGFRVDLDVEKNELFVAEVTMNSQAYKLKVCRGWKVAMVGREDKVQIMQQILKDANKENADDDNTLPLFITFQVSGF